MHPAVCLTIPMATTTQQRRETFGDPIVRLVMRRESFDAYRAAQGPQHQADLDAMIDAGTLVLRESVG